MFTESDIRGELVNLQDSYQQLMANNAYPPAVQELLGQFLAASVLLSTTIKFAGRLVLQARSDGEIPLIMAECTSEQQVRGIARFNDIPVGTHFRELLRNGVLAITIEPEEGESYQGIVPLEQDTLAGCLEDYFQRSEQLASQFHLAADAEACAGLLIQQLPPQLDRDPLSRLEAWNTISHLASTVSDTELLELDNEVLLYRLFHQQQVKLFAPRSVEHRCSCSRERTARALFTLGEAEIMDIVAEQGSLEINCEFCGRQYRFSAEEMRLLFEDHDGQSIH
ncbi:MAG: hypothetical protein RLZZ385_531 [Pseudomonadota bacterium]|jgi:molecular chaperone Hsp33